MSEKYIETEQKFLPLFPERLEQFRKCASKIVQIYLSHPNEEFNLRIREKAAGTGTTYTATLKDTGTQTDTGLRRREFNSTVTKEQYDYYSIDAPTLIKHRAEPVKDVVIYFFEDGHVHAESENPESWKQFTQQYQMENDFIDLTGEKIVDNEWRAHYLYRQQNQGREAIQATEELEATKIVDDILNNWEPGKHLTVAVGGRSGSGKSTLIQKVRKELQDRYITSNILSTDSYNIGNTRLYAMGGGAWKNYDAKDVYDTSLCLDHARMLKKGVPVPTYRFDFKTEEPAPIQYLTRPKDILFIEGIKAHYAEFRELSDLYYEIPTPLATCIGRRVLRDLSERPRFSPEQNISYYLEYAEPEYRSLL